jgi:outer membrane protein assembly factor BamB
MVYIGSGSRYFYALNALSGQPRLHFKSFHPTIASAAINNGIIYFGSTRGYLYAVEGKARNFPLEHEIKPYWIQFWVFGLPVPTPGPQSGFMWSLRVGRLANSSPAVSEDAIYVGADNKLLAIDLESREIRWEFEAEGEIRSSPSLTSSVIYVGSNDGRLYAVDADSGEKLWHFSTGARITSSPAVAGGTVYIGSHDGNLYAIE